MAETVELPVLSERRVEELQRSITHRIKEALARCKPELSPLVALLEPLIDSVSIIWNPPAQHDQLVHCMASVGLTARELAIKISTIEDEHIKKRLAAKVKPFITAKSASANVDVMELFELTSFDDLAHEEDSTPKFDADAVVKSGSDRFKRKVYYSKSILICKNGKFTFLSAYYSSLVVLPYYSFRALLQDDSDRKKEEEECVALGMQKLHHMIAREAPSLVRLRAVEHHNSLIMGSNSQ